jgi:HEAT repeat protein
VPQSFRAVEGPTLEARIEAAGRQARAGRYWTAHGFDVKPGVAIDACTPGDNGSVHVVDNFVISHGEPETRNVAVFMLRTAETGAVERVQIYNLDRERTYEGHPVYWLGRVPNAESLAVLHRLVESSDSKRIAERTIAAIAVHGGKQADDIVEGYARRAPSSDVRESAIMWLGILTTRHAVLAEFVRDERENMEIRKKAAVAIGVSRSEGAIPLLKGLYDGASSNRQLRHEILTAAAIHDGQDDLAVDFLIGVAEKDPDRGNRRQAIFWLGQKAGKRSMDYLQTTVTSGGGDVEVQKQAVFAISQREADEAVPVLIRVARTHPSHEVRKQAVFWLTQTEGQDERVLAFLKELLEK